MTTMFNSSFQCANCQQTSSHPVLGSTNAFGSSDLDLRPPPMQRDTMNTWIQRCPHCSYVAPEIDKVVGDLARLKHPDYQAILSHTGMPDLANDFRAAAFLQAESDPVTAGFLSLRAAWVCDDGEMPQLARRCRQDAADHFMAGDLPANDANLMTRAVLVDVLRRAGQYVPALALVNELLAKDECRDVLRQVLEFQQRLIDAQDVACYTVSNALNQPER